MDFPCCTSKVVTPHKDKNNVHCLKLTLCNEIKRVAFVHRIIYLKIATIGTILASQYKRKIILIFITETAPTSFNFFLWGGGV